MAYRWINRHLKKDNSEVSEPALPPFSGRELRVFPEDRDLPKDSVNDRIDELFVPPARWEPPASREDFVAWSRQMHSRLGERVFTEWPDAVQAGRVVQQRGDNEFLLATQRDLVVQVTLHSPTGAPPDNDTKRRAWLIVLNADEKPGEIPDWAKGVVSTHDRIAVLSPRGGGELAWTRTNPPNYVERAHALLGRTVDVGRVWDVQAAARWFHEADGGADQTLVAVGRGAAGVLGAYAALHEPCIEELLLVDPTASHREGPFLLNVLRVLDVPEALGLFAPRPLTVITRRESAFAKTRQIYSASGQADRFDVRSRRE